MEKLILICLTGLGMAAACVFYPPTTVASDRGLPITEGAYDLARPLYQGCQLCVGENDGVMWEKSRVFLVRNGTAACVPIVQVKDQTGVDHCILEGEACGSIVYEFPYIELSTHCALRSGLWSYVTETHARCPEYKLGTVVFEIRRFLHMYGSYGTTYATIASKELIRKGVFDNFYRYVNPADDLCFYGDMDINPQLAESVRNASRYTVETISPFFQLFNSIS